MEAESRVWDVIGDLEPLLQKDETLKQKSGGVPDFLICGSAKAGTSSLFNYLSQHPSVFTPEIKEPGYFSALRPMRSPDRYAELLSSSGEGQLVGEASGAYLTSPDSAARINNVAPDAKIIIALRNPVDRAFSLYRWMTREGYEWISSFEQALNRESNRLGRRSFIENNPEYYFNYLYRRSGCYAQQVKRYLDLFSRNQVRFVLFDNFVESPSECTKKVFRFLGLDDSLTLSTPVRNKGKDVFSARLQYWLRNTGIPLSRRVSYGASIVRTFMKWNTVQVHREVPSRTRESLLEYYQESVRRTGGLIERDLASLWL